MCSDESFINVAKTVNEVQRVLKTGGFYIIISYGTPENRMVNFKRENLSFKITI